MNKEKVCIFLLIVLVCALQGLAPAGSIWAKRDKNMKDIYADDTARRIGDVVTIKISEDSKVDNKSKRDLEKKTDRSIAFNGELGNFIDLGEFGTKAVSSNELKGKADYKDERSFIDSITVIVVDVLPNGNLVVAGTRHRHIAGDVQIIEVSGVVRTSDIAFDNTIRSEQVANFSIVTKNTGISEPYRKPGWLGGLLVIIWPF